MYSQIDEQTAWVFPRVIEEQADRIGDRTAIAMVDGDRLTYRELYEQSCRVAAFLSDLGVVAGEAVAVMLPNGLDFIRAWAGIGRLGAVIVPVNCELTGEFLLHPLLDCGAKVLVADAACLPRLEAVRANLPRLERILVAGDGGDADASAFAAWKDAPMASLPSPSASDLACIMYTSGTTGAPKGVLMPHAHCFLFGRGVVDNLRIATDDHYYICLPLSHANGLLMQLGAVLIAGASATIRERFSATSWLGDIRRSGATVTHSLGAINAFLIGQSPTEHDRDHQLRLIFSVPNHPEHEQAWRQRFGIPEVLSGFGMTEVNIPIYGEIGVARPGTCGRIYDRFFEVELHDPATGYPVAAGEVGEIVVRPRAAHGFMAGYNNLPAKTVEAWRDLWFHTGDAGRLEQDGYITFVDRIKDCIRRRGENISATDIEACIAKLPAVAEVAAYAVPSDMPGGEDEIMLAVVVHPDGTLAAPELVAHAREHMPRFAQPRYLDVLSSMPKTGTEKVRKAELRQKGVTASTIDLLHISADSWPLRDARTHADPASGQVR